MAFGIGGPRMQAEGLETLVDARELLSMGFGEVLAKLPRIFRALDTLEAQARVRAPDLAVVIDYPDFHLRLAQRLRKQAISCVYLIPPKLWVWRKGRSRKLKTLFRKLLVIFPFEADFYRTLGIEAIYIGNPLLDELPRESDRAGARIKLGIAEGQPVLALMPGSRPAELALHTPVFLDAAARLAERLHREGRLVDGQRLSVLIPLPLTVEPAEFARLMAPRSESFGAAGNARLNLQILPGESALCLAAADAALVKSGTSTLEAAWMGCPHAVVYRTSRLTQWIFKRLVRYAGPVGLGNLVAGRRIVREILLDEVDAPTLAEEAWRLLTDRARILEMKTEFARLRSLLQTDESPSRRAAQEILATYDARVGGAS